MTPTLQSRAFEWRSEYETGMPAIDRQHRQLFRLINELNGAMLQGLDNEVLAGILDRISSYTVIHCQTEEAIMTQAKWAGLDDHQRKHRKLSSEVSNFQSNVKAGNVAISVEMINFLQRWLHKHVEEDMSFTKTVKATTPRPAATAAI